jgi:hypothetical protein
MENGVYVVGEVVGTPTPYTSQKNGVTYYSVQLAAGEVTSIETDAATYGQLAALRMKRVTMLCQSTKYGLRNGKLVSDKVLQPA